MENIINFLSDFQNKKFKTRIGKRYFNDELKIKKDERYSEVKVWLNDKYIQDGMGLKSIIIDYKLPISYSVMRNMLRHFDIKMRENNEITDFIRRRRSQIAKNARINMIGIGSEESIRKTKIRNTTKRGIQGYYWNKSKEKWVWLRSSWEYIYANWLDEKGIQWDVETTIYKLGNQTYRPDFFIYDENMKLEVIVEIKGYWKDKLWKIEELKNIVEGQGVKVSVITDIFPYVKNNIKKDTKKWKTIRKSEQELKEYQSSKTKMSMILQ